MPSSDSLHRLKDESEEEEESSELVARVRSQFEGQGAFEPKRDEADLPQIREGDEEVVDEASKLEKGKAVLA